MKIRPLTENDIPQAMKLLSSEPAVFYGYDLPNARRHLHESLTKNDIHMFIVACKHDKIIGLIGCYKDEDGLNVYGLSWTAVHKQYQRQGIGKELLLKLEKLLKKRRARILYVETSPSYINAIPFYTKLGFKNVGVIPGFYGKDDLLMMYKDLP